MKQAILKNLREEKHVSGEELARKLGLSRAAVWKYVSELRQKGYEISSSPGQGYSFIKGPDLLLPEEIGLGLNTHLLGKKIIYYEEIDSTQDVAKQLARQEAREGITVIANKQTKGRGRIGRSWSSPSGVGIYLSIVLKPSLKPIDALQIPLIAGVAVSQAIEKSTPLKPRIKWPNDIIIGGKKVGGILAEMSAEIDRIDYIVLGIGINVNTPRSLSPQDMRGRAASLAEECGEYISRVQLTQRLLEELESLYGGFRNFGFEPIRERWKAFDSTIGSWVKVSGEEEMEGKAVDIDRDGALVLKSKEGDIRRIIAGDVSLRDPEGRYT